MSEANRERSEVPGRYHKWTAKENELIYYGNYSAAELAEMFGVTVEKVYNQRYYLKQRMLKKYVRGPYKLVKDVDLEDTGEL